MPYAKGKRSLSISDRSGQAFPYTEMVTEWQGSLVHISEYEPKHPQLERKKVIADAMALQNTRSQDFNIISGGEMFTTISLTLPGQFGFNSTGMMPDNGAAQNRARQLGAITGQLNVVIS
jgi:hypothetical protein